MNMYFCTHKSCVLFLLGLGTRVISAQQGLKEGGPAVSFGGGCSGMWREGCRGEGGWDGRDRLSSLPPVCRGWIGDYSSRCVIRSELYSCGCRVTRERLGRAGGHAPQESHFIGVQWIYGICQVVFLPLSTYTHTPPRFLTLVPPSCLSMALRGRKLPVSNTYTWLTVLVPLATLEIEKF